MIWGTCVGLPCWVRRGAFLEYRKTQPTSPHSMLPEGQVGRVGLAGRRGMPTAWGGGGLHVGSEVVAELWTASLDGLSGGAV